MWDITSYGAVGDGKTLNTKAIQSAVCDCAANGGGEVHIPNGIFLSSRIELADNVHLVLSAGAVLQASAQKEDYTTDETETRGYFLHADGARHISVRGAGCVRGTGEADFGAWWGIDVKLSFRVGLLLFERCEDITVTGVSFLYSDSWTLHFRCCENVLISQVKILNNFRHLNSDGIDPNSCKNFIISDCHIIAGDDCIVAKTTQGIPMENLVVTNCILESPSTAIKLGTESHADFRDIHISNCTIRNTSVGIGIYIKDGALAERVSFENISIECADREHVKPVIPLYIDIERRHPDSRLGRVRDITFSNIQINSGSGSLIQGHPDSPVENLTLRNITHRANSAADYTIRTKAIGSDNRTAGDDGRDTRYIRKPAYLALAHIRGLLLDHYSVYLEEAASGLERSAVYASDVVFQQRQAISMNGSSGTLPAFAVVDCRDEWREGNVHD